MRNASFVGITGAFVQLSRLHSLARFNLQRGVTNYQFISFIRYDADPIPSRPSGTETNGVLAGKLAFLLKIFHPNDFWISFLNTRS